ncbi:hypothetical protein [Mucilaginibacter sp.]|uniref:hypothetical protein n=1 Tax=Mucilaginibacter sp. TaxID=1882438 RepID=UPI00262AD0EC|nr:hypothetical protein [Mucilaginibacter sp.]MDB4927276.1 hypothetical protein [Mucilaginibacter sp.]
MKKLLLVCAFVLGVSAVSLAQGRQRMTPEQQLASVKTMIAPLTLTDDQATKLTAVYTANTKSTDSLRTAVPDRDARMPAQTALRTALTAKVNAILTPEQAAALKKGQDEMRAKMQQGGN